MTDLSIIIVNWKSASYLRSCLRTVCRWTQGIRFEVIVVDNASQDGCGEMLGDEFPEVQYIESQENLGFSRANNLGRRHAQGEFLLFLNPDTELSRDVLTPMVAWLQTHPKVGAAGAVLLNTDGSLQDSCVQAFPTLVNQVLDAEVLRRWFPESRLWGKRALFQQSGVAALVDAISGAFFLVRANVFDVVGGFSEEYFMYSDDLDLSYRIQRAGYNVVCMTDCHVIHHGGRSAAKQADGFTERLQRESMARFFLISRGPRYSDAYRHAMRFAAIVRLAAVLAVYPFAAQGSRRQRLGSVVRKWWGILQWSAGAGPRVCR